MSKDTRIRADRQLREDHLRKTLTWYNLRLDRVEQSIMNNMRSNDPDCSQIAKLVNERECIKDNCKKLHVKIYGE